MAAEGGIVTYVFPGEDRDRRGRCIIPDNVTHLLFHESITSIPWRLCYQHPNIIEVYCHVGVKIIEREAFCRCPRLRRVIIPGVEVVEASAFRYCQAVTYVECPKLERIEECAFHRGTSLGSISLPSTKVVEAGAFSNCVAMTDVKFGKNLELIRSRAFFRCHSLERVTVPLKNGLFTDDNIFQCCNSLRHVDLVERAILEETADALLSEEWRNDMNEELDSINRILLNARSGTKLFSGNDAGEKAQAIRDWITHVLRKIIEYKACHYRLLDEAASTLQLILPHDIVINNVLPFLELPDHVFEGENQDEENDDEEEGNGSSDSSDETNYSESGEDDYEEEGDDEEDEDDNDEEFKEQNEEGDVEAAGRKRRKML